MVLVIRCKWVVQSSNTLKKSKAKEKERYDREKKRKRERERERERESLISIVAPKRN